VSGLVCKCFTNNRPPPTFLAFGACSSVKDGTPHDERMEFYVVTSTSSECSDTQTSSVRDQLTLQGKADFGFDIVADSFRNDIFEYTADKCGYVPVLWLW